MPYGTPCSDKFDPATQKLELLQCELETLQKRLAVLLEERDAEAARQEPAGRKAGQEERLSASVHPFPGSRSGRRRSASTAWNCNASSIFTAAWSPPASGATTRWILTATPPAFSAFRRAAERPQARIEKRPALRGKQGMWTLFGEGGQVLKRGQELAGVLYPLERRLLKVVEAVAHLFSAAFCSIPMACIDCSMPF